jgi:hypothetical protein
MTQMYHYATVSKALDELNENGFTYDFNLHEEDIAKNPQSMRLNTFTAMKEILILGMKPFMVSNQLGKRVFVAGFAANSISDAAQALIINIKNRPK